MKKENVRLRTLDMSGRNYILKSTPKDRIFMAIFIFNSQEILPEDFCEEGDYLFVFLNHFLFLNQILVGVGKCNEKKNFMFRIPWEVLRIINENLKH